MGNALASMENASMETREYVLGTCKYALDTRKWLAVLLMQMRMLDASMHVYEREFFKSAHQPCNF